MLSPRLDIMVRTADSINSHGASHAWSPYRPAGFRDALDPPSYSDLQQPAKHYL